MGQIGKGLDAAFEMLVAHLIDHQRQKQRQNTVGHNIHGTHGHGVPQNHAHIRVREKLLEVVKPYKLASQNPLGGTVAEKGHEPAVQGAIVKYSYQNHAGQRHEKQGSLPGYGLQPTAPEAASRFVFQLFSGIMFHCLSLFL